MLYYAAITLYVLENEVKALHQQKDYDSLYYKTHFIVMVWYQTHNISEVCLCFMEAGRRYKTPGSETKDFIIHSTAGSTSIMLMSVLLAPNVQLG